MATSLNNSISSYNQRVIDTQNIISFGIRPGHAFGSDLRLRISTEIYENLNEDFSLPYGMIKILSNRFAVSERTIGRIHEKLKSSILDPSHITNIDLLFGGFYGSLRSSPKIDYALLSYIILILDQFPYLYLHEVSRLIELHWSIRLSVEWIRRTIHYLGYTRKKFSVIHELRFSQINMAKRESYEQLVSQFNAEALYFFDEAGFCGSESLREYGWSDSRRIPTTTPYYRNFPTYNLLCLIGTSGIVAASSNSTTTNALLEGTLLLKFLLLKIVLWCIYPPTVRT